MSYEEKWRGMLGAVQQRCAGGTDAYAEFLASKAVQHAATGIAEDVAVSQRLFPFQQDIVQWALRLGRAAIFAECGLGKSWMALEWARAVVHHKSKPALILTPLSVAQQFVREGQKLWGEHAEAVPRHVRETKDIGDPEQPGIIVCNYEKLDKLDALVPHLGAVVLDESGILKAYDGKTRTRLIESFQRTPFRLACTATPSPNDVTELGNHSEFLGTMSRVEMLATWFTHDGGDTSVWRLKRHAEKDYWSWVRSWAVCLTKPSDLGYSDDGYELPALEVIEHVVDVDQRMARNAGLLFAFEAATLTEQRAVRSGSFEERIELCKEIVG